jgi:hypothetical protein
LYFRDDQGKALFGTENIMHVKADIGISHVIPFQTINTSTVFCRPDGTKRFAGPL